MYQNYAKIRDSFGLTDYRVSVDTGISRGTLSEWKKGKYELKRDKLQKLAEYFDCPIEYLMTGEMPNYYTNTETAEIAQEIFESKEMRALFSAARDASKEDLLTTYQMLLALKKKENRHDD